MFFINYLPNHLCVPFFLLTFAAHFSMMKVKGATEKKKW